eukprot:s2809_g4.t6
MVLMHPWLGIVFFRYVSGQTEIKVAGSSTVFPVANAWANGVQNVSNFAITIEGGGSSTGARRVCKDRADPDHVDIGDMSRNWQSSEALLLDDDYTWECHSSKIRVTQLQVGTDGLAVAVAKGGRAHDCLTSAEVGGLTLAMLHWMFTDWSNEQLASYGVDLASVIPNDDADGIKEWSDLSSACPEVPINIYGPGSDSGTYDFFAEATLCEDCFAGEDGYDPEGFPYCPLDKHSALEQLSTEPDIADFIQNQRPLNCYMHSESDYKLIQWLSADTGGIVYFGYAYFAQYASLLTVARIANDKYKGVKDTANARVEPSTYTITDGSYDVYRRSLFMNVDNEAWDRVHPFLSFGFSSAGQSLVASVGYVAVNAALRSKMKIRIEERGNEEADYVSVAPSSCPVGAELSAVPYINQFGNSKVNYTCSLCSFGTFKYLDIPTACTSCEPGRYTDQVGQSTCRLCDPGYEALNGTSCRACGVGFYKREAAAASCSPCGAGTFNNQTAQAECAFCGPGYFAPEGSTQCSACPLNEVAPAPGSASCNRCGDGFTTTQVGSTACSRCRAGTFRSNETQCVHCAGDKTTAFQGAVLKSDCICPAGKYLRDGLTGDSVEAMSSGTCVECSDGMDCPLGSDLRIWASFLAGAEMDPEDQLFPLLQPGYYSTPEEPTQAYKCGAPSHCPGGRPGTCAEGRVGTPCGRCEAGSKFEDGQCIPCGGSDSLLFAAGAVVMAFAIPTFYYFMNSPMTSKASTMLSTTMAFGMTLTLLQTVGLVGLVSLSWPSYMQPFLDFVSIFMLDLESLNFDCVGTASATRYGISVMVWPAVLIWLVVCVLLSKLGPRKMRFVRAKALSTLGQLFQIGFTIIAKTSLMPFMCYSHPNGKSSVLRFSDVICWEEQSGHTTMVIFGIFMTTMMILCWSTLVWTHSATPLAVEAPKRSANGDHFFLSATRFLFFRFRTDYWWYGTWFILRGPLLSLPVVIFTDLPQVQLFVMTAVLVTYMVMQLTTWPWKTPLINLADGAMSMMFILLLAVGASFLDSLEGEARAAAASLAVAVLGILYFIAFVLLCLVAVAMLHKTAMGSASELPILTLGRPPSNTELRQALDSLHAAYEEAAVGTIEAAIEDLSVYDRRMLATVLTTLAPYFSNDKRLRLMRRLSVSVTTSQSALSGGKPSPTAADLPSQADVQKLLAEELEAERSAEEEAEEANAGKAVKTETVESDLAAAPNPSEVVTKRFHEKMQSASV